MMNNLLHHQKIKLWLEYMKPNLEKEIKRIQKYRPISNKQIKKIMSRQFSDLMSYQR